MTTEAISRVSRAAREIEHLRIVIPLENRLEQAISRAFRAQERAFMGRFRQLRPLWRETEVKESLLPGDWEPLFAFAAMVTTSLFRLPLTAVQRLALLAGARTASADVGIEASFNLANPRAVAYLDQVPNRVAGINETTRQEVQAILGSAAYYGWSYDRTAQQLRKRWAEFRTPAPQKAIRSRAHLIAVTEVGDAYAEGNLIVGRELADRGLRVEKHWYTAGDERTCPICTGNEAQGWIPVDQLFGSGHDAPTGHPACRCDLVQRTID